MRITKLSRQGARRLFRCCLVNGVLDEKRARQAVGLLISQKPRGYFGVLSQFERLVKLDEDRHLVRVESATLLAPAMQTQVQADLARLYGAGLNVNFVQNPDLLGGMRVQVGGDVYDGSIKARLTALRESF